MASACTIVPCHEKNLRNICEVTTGGRLFCILCCDIPLTLTQMIWAGTHIVELTHINPYKVATSMQSLLPGHSGRCPAISATFS